jgi:hypothetical protein
MKRNSIPAVAALMLAFVALFAIAGCKSSGTAITGKGQIFKINIVHPTDLPDNGEDNLDVVLSNRGVRDVKDILVDVELPPQLVVLDQTNERGVNASNSSGVYHFTLGNLQKGESSTLRFHVRTAFGTMRETGGVKVTAWQQDLTGEKLVETAVIRLRN